MDTNSVIIVVAIIFAVVIIIGLIIFRRKAKVDLEIPGSKLKFEGENSESTPKDAKSKDTKSKNRSNGIFGNFSIGKTRMKVKGSGTIAGNKNIGDTEITKEDTPVVKKKK